MTPLISIGMPVYNCEQTIAQAIRSILLQTYENWELILIDDCSTDGTLAVARQFTDPRIRIFSDEKNRKLPAQLNRAVALSQGTYFARMDGDDISYPERFERQVTYLESYPHVDLTGTRTIRFKDNGIVIGKNIVPVNHSQICSGSSFTLRSIQLAHVTFMGHLSWFQKNPYNENVIRSQDQELLHRTFKNSTFANVPEILLGIREDKLDLKKILYSKGRFFSSAAMKQKRYGAALLTAIIFGMKVSLYWFAITTGLNYRVLPHRRGKPLTPDEQAQWETVWNSVQ